MLSIILHEESITQILRFAYLQWNSLDDINGIDYIAKRFAHFSAMRISYHGVEEHFSEWQLTSKLEAKLHHPGNPEKQDVVSSFQERSRIENLVIFRLQRQNSQVSIGNKTRPSFTV